MKVGVERTALLKAMGHAQSVVERRTTIPILANVLLEASDGKLTFRATDLDIEIVDTAEAQVDQAGACTVSAHMLHDIVRKLPEGAQIALALDPEASRLAVRAGRSSFQLPTLPVQDFPQMASETYEANFAVPAPTLRRLFDKAKFAISNEETRYYLNGVYLHAAERDGAPVLRCVATDGHRLARVDAALPDAASGLPGVIVPRKTVGELRRLLDDDGTEIAVSVSETKIRFAAPGMTLTSKVIDGSFPDYARVIPGRERQGDAGRCQGVCTGRRSGRDRKLGAEPSGQDGLGGGSARALGQCP